jgi:hypothetical protein
VTASDSGTFEKGGELVPPGQDEGDRISITDVNGTVARFDMSYSPPRAGERTKFGPPLRVRIPGFLHLAGAMTLACLVGAAYVSSPNSPLFRFFIEGDRSRPLSSGALAVLVLLSGVAAVIRAHMRGVIVHSDGLEARYSIALGLVPRVRRWAWPQIDRIVVDERRVMLELWDSTYEHLPAVAEPARLREMLERICASRKIPVTQLPHAIRPRRPREA